MSEGLRAEDVKEALDEAEDAVTYQAEVLASEHPWPTVVAAARAWLEQTEGAQGVDVEAATIGAKRSPRIADTTGGTANLQGG